MMSTLEWLEQGTVRRERLHDARARLVGPLLMRNTGHLEQTLGVMGG